MIWMINAGKPAQQGRETPMRFAFTAVTILFACLVLCPVAPAGEVTVLNHGAPTAAPTEAAPAPQAVVVAAEPAVVAAPCCCSNNACSAGTARVRTRYRVVENSCDACTGQSVRSVSRGVVRGTGEVVRGVGAAAVNVITLPVRACRGGRCSCN